MSIVLPLTKATLLPTFVATAAISDGDRGTLNTLFSGASTASAIITGLPTSLFVAGSALMLHALDSVGNAIGTVGVGPANASKQYPITFRDAAGLLVRDPAPIAEADLDTTIENILTGYDERFVYRPAGLVGTDLNPIGLTPLKW